MDNTRAETCESRFESLSISQEVIGWQYRLRNARCRGVAIQATWRSRQARAIHDITGRDQAMAAFRLSLLLYV